MYPTEPTPRPTPMDPTDPAMRTAPMDPTAPTPAPGRATGHPGPPPPRQGSGAQAQSARVSTMVWGLLTIVVGLIAMAVATGRSVDLEIALISIFLLAGAGLLVGAGVSAWQRSRGYDLQRDSGH